MKFKDLPHGNAALAIFPSVSGFGWILFDGPLSPVSWGVSYAARGTVSPVEKNSHSLASVEELITQHRPRTLAFETFDGVRVRRRGRIRILSKSIISLASMQGIEVNIISRARIAACFRSADAITRYDVAKVVASYLPEIRRLLPEKRKPWEGEDPNMALFNAAALLIAHYANPQEPL